MELTTFVLQAQSSQVSKSLRDFQSRNFPDDGLMNRVQALSLKELFQPIG
jgi:hypothetical protein